MLRWQVDMQMKNGCTFGKRLSSSIREMMLSGFAASRSRISWLSVNSMCSHLMSSLSYSACRGESCDVT